VGVYYYTPFERTDDNERQTWNLCLNWGAKFANCKTGNEVAPVGRDVGSSGPRKYMSPEELADQLLSDGLENHKINIILICCYGAGPLESEGRDLKTKPNWIGAPDASEVYAGGTLAQSLAKYLGAGLRLKPSLGGRTDVPLKVAGFMGPTYTKGGSLQVTSDQKKNVRAPAWGFARGFDATGSASTSNTNVTDTGLARPPRLALTISPDSSMGTSSSSWATETGFTAE